MKEKHISTLTNQHSYKVSQFHKTLKANCGQNLSRLQVSIQHLLPILFVRFNHKTRIIWRCEWNVLIQTKYISLQSTCLNDPNLNFVQFLQEIASEQQFEVTFVDIEEKTYSGKFQCLVQLSTLPVAVVTGCGNNQTTAQTSAARNALEYLKIMTKI